MKVNFEYTKDEYKKYQVKTISPVEKRVFKDFKSNKCTTRIY